MNKTSLDTIIRCYRAMQDRKIPLTTLDADARVTAQRLLDSIPQLIAIAEAAEAILLCGDLNWCEPQIERDRRQACLRDALGLGEASSTVEKPRA